MRQKHLWWAQKINIYAPCYVDKRYVNLKLYVQILVMQTIYI